MKKITLLAVVLFVAATAMAQETFPNAPADPGAVPIVESILGLLGLGGAYAYRLFKKGKKED
ncbi:MAG: hypothetical protein IKY54_06715 [Muribaculaceae bacterium]|nr:hypothetical protein [Muribaculaceae bacterium]